MKYLLKFNENVESMLNERFFILKGWIKMELIYDHWISHFRYKIRNNIFIDLITMKDSKNSNYYFYFDDERYYISSFNDHFSLIYSAQNIDSFSLKYDIMMKYCNLLLPFFEKKYNDDDIDNIEEHFLLLSDIIGDPSIKWGYNNESEFGFFPSYRNTDKLGLSISYSNEKNIEYDIIEKYYEKIKRTFVLLNIEHRDINIYSLSDNYEIIIVINI